MKKGTLVAIVVVAILAIWGVSSYNHLVTLDQAVQVQWAQVEDAYHRRLDQVPGLVEAVNGAGAFEKETFTSVAEARAQAGRVTVGRDLTASPEAFARFEQAQSQLSQALARLLGVVERYPALKETRTFQDLLAQLEGTEQGIAERRVRFNEAAQEFNASRRRFPTVLIAGLTGFREKQYFRL